jgi:hypothetical protein
MPRLRRKLTVLKKKMMKHKHKYGYVRSMAALQRERCYMASDIDFCEKKIRNEYSVFKSSFSIRKLVHSALSRVPMYAFISRILPLLRKP